MMGNASLPAIGTEITDAWNTITAGIMTTIGISGIMTMIVARTTTAATIRTTTTTGIAITRMTAAAPAAALLRL